MVVNVMLMVLNVAGRSKLEFCCLRFVLNLFINLVNYVNVVINGCNALH